ncbi:hypothetical protein [Rhodococcus sp. 4CII]|uniref:hypothetical protein n=1 Tax=Rhodococcus sp. 4CII TaxID=2834580 RepID=UPI002078F24A|nr:hypothetical protein [Rhodococcus sp. 4CII]
MDIDDAGTVVVGSLDFTVIGLGTADPIVLCLDRVGGDHEMRAGLFDGNHLTEQYGTLTVLTEGVLIRTSRSSPNRCGATIGGCGWWPRRFIGCCPPGSC